ncbi:hypothetical protein GCM10009554_29410 [Kribbella koreensis]|uniref:Uncharacterized protein n=1 Tax=Kribbella koreensis TaxID=57909 RepID=A0ABP4AR72_9ACTN
MASPYEGYFVYGSQDPRSRLLTGLGFTLPSDLDKLLADPVYKALGVAKQGRGVYIEENYDDDLYSASSFVSILSLPTVLDQLVPRLARAVDGNPATT